MAERANITSTASDFSTGTLRAGITLLGQAPVFMPGILDFTALNGAVVATGLSVPSVATDVIFLVPNDLAIGANIVFEQAGGTPRDVALEGGGTLTVLGAWEFGSLTISEGAVRVGDGGPVGSISGTVHNNAELIFDRSDDFAVGEVISGSGALIKDGVGVLTVTGQWSLENFHIEEGALRVGDGGTSGSISGDVQNDAELIFNRSDDIAFNDVISGFGTLVKRGAGVLTLSGDNSYFGLTEVEAGVLNIRHRNALGDGVNGTTVQSGAVLEIQGGVSLVDALALAGTGAFGGGALRSVSGSNGWVGQIDLDGSVAIGVDAGILTLAGAISGDALEKVGSDYLVLAAANTFTGALTVSEGGLVVSHAGALGTTGGGTAVASHATLVLEDGVTVTGEALTLNGFGVSMGALVGRGNSAWGGTITLAGGAPVVIGVNSGDTLSVTGAVSGGTSDDLVKYRTGVLVLSGANSFQGATVVQEGLLNIRHASALGDDLLGTVVASGAGLAVQDGIAVTSEALTLNGTGGGDGALRSLSGDNIWGGGIELASDASIEAAGGSLTISGVIDGSGQLEISGAGSVILSGSNIYSGATTVSDGTLLVAGSITSATTVQSGGTLGGTGTVGTVAVQSGGTLAAGASPGVLTTGNLDLQAGASLAVEIAGATAGQFDQLAVVGTVTLAGELDVTLLNSFSPISGTFVIIDNDGADAVSGTFADWAPGATFDVGSTRFSISYVGGDGNDVVLTAAAVPPPPTPDPDPEPMTRDEIRRGFFKAVGFRTDDPKASSATLILPNGQTVANPVYEAVAALNRQLDRFEAGLITEAQLIDAVVDLAGPTSAVALQAYQFFTGGVPTKAGMTWLTNSTGNPNDLTDGYYATFSEANRFINFAVGLGAHGEGRAAFQAGYDALDFAAAVRKAYDQIIGLDEARAAKIDVGAAIAWVTGQKAYFEAVGGSALGGKAAMVGYLMYAGFEAKVGVYYEATHDWLEDAFKGEPDYGVSMVGGASGLVFEFGA